MKKIIALVIAIVMMAAISVPAFAATFDETAVYPADAEVEITYTLAEGWEVTIPDSVALDSTAAAVTIALTEDAGINWNKRVAVTVAGEQDGKFAMTNYTTDAYTAAESGAPLLEYQINEGDVTVGGEIASLQASAIDTLAKVGAELTFSLVPTDVVVAGYYMDTLTFTVTVGARA